MVADDATVRPPSRRVRASSGTMSAQLVVDATDERERAIELAELEKVADRERIGPQIAALRGLLRLL
jgi:hypothetical protein